MGQIIVKAGREKKEGTGEFTGAIGTTREHIPGEWKYKIYEWNKDAKNYVDTGEWTDFVLDADREGIGIPFHETLDIATNKMIDPESNEWGAANITADMFIYPEGHEKAGQQRPIEEVYAKLDPLLPNITGDELKAQINDMFPKYQKVAEEEMGFLTEEQRIAGGKADIYGLETDLATQKAEDVYGLGMDAAERERQSIEEKFGLGIKATRRAGEALEEQYGLGVSAAERGLESGLGQLQQQAGQAGAQMSAAYGSGMGAQMRGAFKGHKAITKGFGQAYGAFGDEKTRLAGIQERGLGALSDEKTRLRGERERGLGAYGSEQDRLEQELGYVTGEGGTEAIAALREQAMRDAAQLGYDRGEYGLQEKALGEFETGISTALDPSWFETPETGAQVTPWGDFRGGGRVPKKEETFSHFLTQLPDAGGS